MIACGCSDKTLSLLSSKLEILKIPLLVVRTSGFFGYIRLQLSEHVIVETHPDNIAPDLRFGIELSIYIFLMKTVCMELGGFHDSVLTFTFK